MRKKIIYSEKGNKMATTELERAVDDYVDGLTSQQLREIVFSKLLDEYDDVNIFNTEKGINNEQKDYKVFDKFL
jgi:hypothetical protein|tara:strand:- start:118 stop:339 length:222 start_codon:yes stop_codon:yes gene_type:complete